MSGRYVLTPLALSDLAIIWNDTVARWGMDQAEDYIRQIDKHIQMIADRPLMGRACPEIRAGYRKFRSGSHILFYTHDDAGIDVIRILHERMDHIRHV